MTAVALIALAGACVALPAWRALHAVRARRRNPPTSARRILFPFIGGALSEPVLDATLRIARAETATLIGVYLARVPMHLPLGAPLPRQCNEAMALLEVIEHRASRVNVSVDARIERGRTYRHALRELLEHEHPDRVVIAADTAGTDGFDAADVAWLLEHAEGEILVLRPAHDYHLRAPAGVQRPAAPAHPPSAADQRVQTPRWCSPDMLSRRALR